MRRLHFDGEERIIGSRSPLGAPICVIAERIDSDTPVIHLVVEGNDYGLTDCDAKLLVKKLTMAINILPSSK